MGQGCSHIPSTTPVVAGDDATPPDWSVLDLLSDVVLIIDRGSVIQGVNKQCLPGLGYAQEDLLGKSVQVLIPKSVYPGMDHASLTRDFRFGAPSNIVNHRGRLVTVQRKDGTLVDMRLTVMQQGALFYGTLANVEGPMVVNDQTLTFVSHETRNFLMVARGGVEAVVEKLQVLQDSTVPTGYGLAASCPAPALRDMQRSVDDALEAIDSTITVMRDLTTLSQAAHKSLQCHRTWMSLRELFDKLQTHAAGSKKGERSLAIRADRPPDVTVHVGLQHLEQLIMNLVANATKYASSQVRVTMSADAGDRDREYPDSPTPPGSHQCVTVTIKVDDDGPGIAAEDRHRVFDKYVRLRRSEDSVHAGSGLGLHLCQVFAAEHDGTITVEDSEAFSTGSLFLVCLRLPCVTSTSIPSLASTSLDEIQESKISLQDTRGSIMVVDDSMVVRRLMAKYVQRAMPRAVVAEAACVSDARAQLTDRHFDVIMTDFHLPDGTGDDIVAGVSATWRVCVSGESKLPSAANFDMCLIKPVTYRHVYDMLYNYFNAKPSVTLPAVPGKLA